MLDIHMKMEASLLANESRNLRAWEIRAKKKTRKTRGNYPLWEIRRELFYNERMGVRRCSRLLHLARAFQKGTPYHFVEQSVREGNRPDAKMVALELQTFGHSVPEHLVKEWMEA